MGVAGQCLNLTTFSASLCGSAVVTALERINRKGAGDAERRREEVRTVADPYRERVVRIYTD